MGVLEFEGKMHQAKIIITSRGRNLLGLRDCNELDITVWTEVVMRNMIG